MGTPNGAAPGNANENVGLAADGTPPEPRNPDEPLLFALALDLLEDGVPGFGFLAFGFLAFGFFLALGALRVDGRCFFPAPAGEGAPEAPVEEPVEVVVVVGTDTEPDPVDPVAPVPVEPDPGAPVEHDSETPRTGSLTGSEIDDSGVPAGTFTVNDSLPPPTTVTVTTHESA